MEFEFSGNMLGNKMFVDPHVRKPTEVYINYNLFCKIEGYIFDQCEQIKNLIKQNNITFLTIDKAGFGRAWYDELTPWFEEYLYNKKSK